MFFIGTHILKRAHFKRPSAGKGLGPDLARHEAGLAGLVSHGLLNQVGSSPRMASPTI